MIYGYLNTARVSIDVTIMGNQQIKKDVVNMGPSTETYSILVFGNLVFLGCAGSFATGNDTLDHIVETFESFGVLN